MLRLFIVTYVDKNLLWICEWSKCTVLLHEHIWINMGFPLIHRNNGEIGQQRWVSIAFPHIYYRKIDLPAEKKIGWFFYLFVASKQEILNVWTSELGKLTALKILAANGNFLHSLPACMETLSSLEELSLQVKYHALSRLWDYLERIPCCSFCWGSFHSFLMLIFFKIFRATVSSSYQKDWVVWALWKNYILQITI
jgi:hypothetical protein